MTKERIESELAEARKALRDSVAKKQNGKKENVAVLIQRIQSLEAQL